MRIARGLALLLAVWSGAASASGTSPLADRTNRAAACIVGGNRGASARLAVSAPESPAEADAYAVLDRPIRRCFARHQLGDSPSLRAIVAGRIAERLYRRSVLEFRGQRGSDLPPEPAEASGGDKPGAPPPSTQPVTVPAGSIPGFLERVGRAEAEYREDPTLSRLAWCAVHGAPQDVDTLVRTDEASSDEREAFAILTPVFSACLNAGQQLAGSRLALRAELARALYRYMDGPHEYP